MHFLLQTYILLHLQVKINPLYLLTPATVNYSLCILAFLQPKTLHAPGQTDFIHSLFHFLIIKNHLHAYSFLEKEAYRRWFLFLPRYKRF